MKEKIKIVVRYLVSGLFLLPVAALAQFQPPANTNLPQSSIFAIIQNVMLWLLGILGFIAVIGFVISGILYLVAAGDEDAQARAKRAMIYSITGVIVGLVGLVILFAVQRLLGGQQQF
jgi:hypothetical protein